MPTISGLRARSIVAVVVAAVLLAVTSCASKDPAPSNQAVTPSSAAGTTAAVTTTAPTTTSTTSTTTSTTAAPPTTKKPTVTTAKRVTTTKPPVNDPAFTPEAQQVFLSQCEKDSGNPNLSPQTRSAICQCALAEIMRTMTFAEVTKIGLDVANGTDPRTTAVWPIMLKCAEPYR